MKALINAIPILVIVVLGGLAVKGTVNGDSKLSKNGESVSCEVVKGSIYDGDTLRVKCGESEKKVRLACIDAPEAKQEGGIKARDYLRSLINQHGSAVDIIPLEQDRYGRTVAELILAPGKLPEVSIQEEMLKSGNARIYEQYSNCPNILSFRTAEEMGKESKLGVWSYNSIPPWEWRKNNK